MLSRYKNRKYRKPSEKRLILIVFMNGKHLEKSMRVERIST